MVTAHIKNISPMCTECKFTYSGDKFRALLIKESRPHPYLDLDLGFTRCVINREGSTIPVYETTEVDFTMDELKFCIEDFTGHAVEIE